MFVNFYHSMMNQNRIITQFLPLFEGVEEKGFVGYKAYGNTYQYYALVSEKEYKSSALKEVVSQYYNNSYINVVSSFIEEEGMSVDELKSLIEYIEQSKKKK